MTIPCARTGGPRGTAPCLAETTGTCPFCALATGRLPAREQVTPAPRPGRRRR